MLHRAAFAPGFRNGKTVVEAGLDIGQLDGLRQLRLLGAGDAVERRLGCRLRQLIRRHGHDSRLAAHEHAQPSAAFHRIDSHRRHQRLERVAAGHHAVDDKARHQALDAGNIDIAQAVARHHLGHQRPQRQQSGAPVQPVATRVVHGVRPQVVARRELRIGPCIPGPQEDAPGIHHAHSVHLRDRVSRRVRPVFIEGSKVARLHQVVARAA